MTTAKKAPGRPSASFPILSRRLLLEDWPESDRSAWERASQPGRALRKAGPAANLRPSTRAKYVDDWRRYLRFLGHNELLLTEERVADRLTPYRLGDFILAMLEVSNARTVRCRIIQLSYVAGVLVPERDWSWVRRHPALPSDADALASSKMKPICDPRDVIVAALASCKNAETMPLSLRSAVRYRDGVMLALAFTCFLRRRNLCELKIGASIIVTNGYVMINLNKDAVKNGCIIDVLVPDFLLHYIRRYIDTYRPVLLQGCPDCGFLWINDNGEAVAYAALYGIFKTRTKSLHGEALNPHATRSSLATMVLNEDPTAIELAADCLAHRGVKTVQRYYNQSGPAAASKAWNDLLKRCAAGDGPS